MIGKKYESSGLLISGLDFSMEEMKKYGKDPGFLKIREEISRFLLNMNQSNMAESEEQEIQYLFMALVHLDNLDREIRISGENEEIIRLEMIHEKIRSLKTMIQEYIRQVADG